MTDTRTLRELAEEITPGGWELLGSLRAEHVAETARILAVVNRYAAMMDDLLAAGIVTANTPAPPPVSGPVYATPGDVWADREGDRRHIHQRADGAVLMCFHTADDDDQPGSDNHRECPLGLFAGSLRGYAPYTLVRRGGRLMRPLGAVSVDELRPERTQGVAHAREVWKGHGGYQAFWTEGDTMRTAMFAASDDAFDAVTPGHRTDGHVPAADILPASGPWRLVTPDGATSTTCDVLVSL